MNTLTNPDVVTLLDACAVINLYATRHRKAIVAAVPTRVGVVDRVQAEAHYVRRGGSGEDSDERETVDLASLIVSGDIQIVTPTQEELDRFLALTVQMDDGEAMTGAVALVRGWVVVTDDRKAERILRGQIRIRSSLDLIKTWADLKAIDQATIREVLTDLRERGTYFPHRSHPLRTWWDAVLASQ